MPVQLALEPTLAGHGIILGQRDLAGQLFQERRAIQAVFVWTIVYQASASWSWKTKA